MKSSSPTPDTVLAGWTFRLSTQPIFYRSTPAPCNSCPIAPRGRPRELAARRPLVQSGLENRSGGPGASPSASAHLGRVPGLKKTLNGPSYVRAWAALKTASPPLVIPVNASLNITVDILSATVYRECQCGEDQLHSPVPAAGGEESAQQTGAILLARKALSSQRVLVASQALQ